MPSRRHVLAACATGFAGALAGCIEADVAITVDPAPDDRSIAERATIDPSRDRDDARASLVADAVDGGTEVADDRRPFAADRPVLHDGAVYDVTWEVVGQRTRTEFVIEGTVRPDDDREPEIAVDDLPAVDREAIRVFTVAARDIESSESAGTERVESQRYYDEAERETSVLVPEPAYDVIDVDGTPVEIAVHSVEAEVDVFRYEAEELAPSLQAFGRRVREAHLFELDGLNDQQRQFFESVIEDGSYVDGDPEDGFEGVADRLVAEPAIFVDSREGEWLLTYDGDTYWVTVDFVGMEEYADQLERADGPANVRGDSSGDAR